jgi:hypothetical protein
VRSYFSVGVAITEPIRAAIVACVDWIPAIDADRELRDGADIAELTHLVDLSAYPQGTRMMLDARFDAREGLRNGPQRLDH